MHLIYSGFTAFISPFAKYDDYSDFATNHRALPVRRSLFKCVRKKFIPHGQYAIDINSTWLEISFDFEDDAPTCIAYTDESLKFGSVGFGEFCKVLFFCQALLKDFWIWLHTLGFLSHGFSMVQ